MESRHETDVSRFIDPFHLCPEISMITLGFYLETLNIQYPYIYTYIYIYIHPVHSFKRLMIPIMIYPKFWKTCIKSTYLHIKHKKKILESFCNLSDLRKPLGRCESGQSCHQTKLISDHFSGQPSHWNNAETPRVPTGHYENHESKWYQSTWETNECYFTTGHMYFSNISMGSVSSTHQIRYHVATQSCQHVHVSLGMQEPQ